MFELKALQERKAELEITIPATKKLLETYEAEKKTIDNCITFHNSAQISWVIVVQKSSATSEAEDEFNFVRKLGKS